MPRALRSADPKRLRVPQVFFPFLVSASRSANTDSGEPQAEELRLRALLQAQKLADAERRHLCEKLELHKTALNRQGTDDSGESGANHPPRPSLGRGGSSMRESSKTFIVGGAPSKPALRARAERQARRARSCLSWAWASAIDSLVSPQRRVVLSAFYNVRRILQSAIPTAMLPHCRDFHREHSHTTLGHTPLESVPISIQVAGAQDRLPCASRRSQVPAVRFVTHFIVQSLLFAFQLAMIFRFKTPSEVGDQRPPLLSNEPIEMAWVVTEFTLVLDGEWRPPNCSNLLRAHELSAGESASLAVPIHLWLSGICTSVMRPDGPPCGRVTHSHSAAS